MISPLDLQVLFNVISNKFDDNMPAQAYALMSAYDSLAQALNCRSWMDKAHFIHGSWVGAA